MKEALVEVTEGKKLRKRGKEDKFRKSEKKKRENIEAVYERLKIHSKPLKKKSGTTKKTIMIKNNPKSISKENKSGTCDSSFRTANQLSYIDITIQPHFVLA